MSSYQIVVLCLMFRDRVSHRTQSGWPGNSRDLLLPPSSAEYMVLGIQNQVLMLTWQLLY